MILFRYTIREHILPFIYAFAIIIFFMVMNLAVQLLDKIISKGLSPQVVIELFLIQLGWIIALAIPMAVLVSTLTTFGRMSADNEILAIKASGRNIFHIMTPVLLASAVLALLLVFFNNLILPDSNHRAANLTRDISRKKPAAFIEPGVLTRDFTNYVLYVDKVNPRSGKLGGIKIFSDMPGQDASTTVADSGYVTMTDDQKFLKLTLYSGQSHSINAQNNLEHRIGLFEKQVIFIANVDDNLHRSESGYRGDREKSAEEMMREVKELRESRDLSLAEHNSALDSLVASIAALQPDSLPANPVFKPDSAATFLTWAARFTGPVMRIQSQVKKELRNTSRLSRTIDSQDRKSAQYLVEVHKKYSIPATALVFVLIGAPLGIMARRGGLTVGGSYSIAFFILFWVFLIGGERLADRMLISPALAMWAGPAIVGAFGVVLVFRMMREATFISFAPLVRLWSHFSEPRTNRPFDRLISIPGLIVKSLFALPRLMLRIPFKTLPVYLIGKFTAYLSGLTGALAVVFVIVDYVSNLRKFEGVPPNSIGLYYYYYLPFIVLTIVPIVILLATMFSIGAMARHSEITAMRGAGINVRQLTMPLLLIGAGLALAAFFAGEMVLPEANQLRKQLSDDMREGVAQQSTLPPGQRFSREFRRNFYYFGNRNTIYCFEEFRTQPQRSRNVWRESFDGNRVVQRIQANSLHYKDSAWFFVDGNVRAFYDDSSRVTTFDTLADTVLSSSPDEMVMRIKGKEEMSYWELSNFIDKVQRRGEKVSQYTAELYFKIALPIMNFIVILLGISITAKMGRKGGAMLFGVGLLLTFAYWIIARFALAFAQNGQIPPLVGAWFGNALFALLGLILYRKAVR